MLSIPAAFPLLCLATHFFASPLANSLCNACKPRSSLSDEPTLACTYPLSSFSSSAWNISLAVDFASLHENALQVPPSSPSSYLLAAVPFCSLNVAIYRVCLTCLFVQYPFYPCPHLLHPAIKVFGRWKKKSLHNLFFSTIYYTFWREEGIKPGHTLTLATIKINISSASMCSRFNGYVKHLGTLSPLLQ